MDNLGSAAQGPVDPEIAQSYTDDGNIFDVNKPVPEVPPSPPAIRVTLVDEEEKEELQRYVNEDSAADEPSNNLMENYWGLVEQLPLELAEISPPPISSPSRLFVSSLSTLVEEASLESNAEDASEPIVSSAEEFETSGRQFGSIGIQTQTSFTNVACPSELATSSNVKSSPSNSMELDWEQFVMVDNLEDNTQQWEESFSSLAVPDAGSVPMHEVADSLEERLRKRMKNWPSYLQNLMEAQHS